MLILLYEGLKGKDRIPTVQMTLFPILGAAEISELQTTRPKDNSSHF